MTNPTLSTADRNYLRSQRRDLARAYDAAANNPDPARKRAALAALEAFDKANPTIRG